MRAPRLRSRGASVREPTRRCVKAGAGRTGCHSKESQGGAPSAPAADPFGPFGNTAKSPAPNIAQDTKPAAPASFDDAYWASQPPAVQKLRDISDYDQRTQAAAQLMNQGYSIDVPIMMWGWDPQITMQLRQSYGYTWVPSATDNPIQTAPGLAVPGLAAYDPNSGTPGAIEVSTNANDYKPYQMA